MAAGLVQMASASRPERPDGCARAPFGLGASCRQRNDGLGQRAALEGSAAHAGLGHHLCADRVPRAAVRCLARGVGPISGCRVDRRAAVPGSPAGDRSVFRGPAADLCRSGAPPHTLPGCRRPGVAPGPAPAAGRGAQRPGPWGPRGPGGGQGGGRRRVLRPACPAGALPRWQRHRRRRRDSHRSGPGHRFDPAEALAAGQRDRGPRRRGPGPGALHEVGARRVGPLGQLPHAGREAGPAHQGAVQGLPGGGAAPAAARRRPHHGGGVHGHDHGRHDAGRALRLDLTGPQ
mmetsp:Transcript_57711/g.185467  ORF Transcript_57711/g.185467 Transcript_57711/m.185467 type:complete len:290 (-) Transcript_57711:828-1697(-)